jgi:predicted esterase
MVFLVRFFRFWSPFLAVCSLQAGFFGASDALGQMESMRFELGRRLTRFEHAWETADAKGRTACVRPMEDAVRSFFSLQLDTAAKLLDQSTQSVQGTSTAKSIPWLAANRFSIDFETSWRDACGGPLRFRLRQIAPPPPPPTAPESVPFEMIGSLELRLLDGTRPIASGRWEGILPLFAPGTSEETWHSWELPSLPVGDYQVSAICKTRDGEFDMIAEGLSISTDLAQRMERVAMWYDENRRGKGDTPIATARWLARELKQGEKGQPTEIDIPWNTWLVDFEALRDRNVDYLKSIAQTAPRSYWLQLSDGAKSQIVRIGVPKPPAKPSPVLFAFHGAGGSENMFFEAYGAGRLIDMAHERGWLVVSPRQSLNGLGMDIDGMLDAIEPWFPIDRSQVMLVGHSMGAAQAISQVSAHADRVRAVAALGGGGMPRSSLQSSPVRFFVAAGDRDFGRPRAKSLADSLRNLDCDVTYRDYSDVEHMVIVQAALTDVFAFLDHQGE